MSQFQDIIPPEKRSIRNVPLNKSDSVKPKPPRKHSKKEESEEQVTEAEAPLAPETLEKDPWVYEPKEPLHSYGGKKTTGLPKTMLWVIAVVSLAALFFAVSWLFAGATVRVALKKIPVTLDGSHSFTLSPQGDQVGYSVLKLSETAASELKATGEKQVTSNASGSIIVYNNYNASPQKLITGTRFKTPEGLIYKLDEAVTVPGKKGSTPGSVEAKVTAEKPGNAYNIGLTDFVIPGFEGDPRYTSFYGRSKTPMAGGASGMTPVVDEGEKANEVDKLKADLRTTLMDRVHKELPPTSSTLSGLEEITYTTSETSLGDGKAKVEVTANLRLYVLDTASFARSILADQNITPEPGDSFVLDTTSASATTTVTSTSTLEAALSGKLIIQYALDTAAFQQDIAGLPKDKVVDVINTKYPQITTVAVHIRPFWRSTIPAEANRIEVIKE